MGTGRVSGDSGASAAQQGQLLSSSGGAVPAQVHTGSDRRQPPAQHSTAAKGQSDFAVTDGSMLRPSALGNARLEGEPDFPVSDGSMLRPSAPGNTSLEGEPGFPVSDGTMLRPSEPGPAGLAVGVGECPLSRGPTEAPNRLEGEADPGAVDSSALQAPNSCEDLAGEEPQRNPGLATFGRNGSMLPPSQAGNVPWEGELVQPGHKGKE